MCGSIKSKAAFLCVAIVYVAAHFLFGGIVLKKLVKPFIALLPIFLLFSCLPKNKQGTVGKAINLKNNITLTVIDINCGKEFFTDRPIVLSFNTAAVVSFIVNNTSEKDYSVSCNDIYAKSENGTHYKPSKLCRNIDGKLLESDGTVEKNTSVEFKAFILLDEKAADSGTPVKLNIYDYQFE